MSLKFEKYKLPAVFILVFALDFLCYGAYPCGWPLGIFALLLIAAILPENWNFMEKSDLILTIFFGGMLTLSFFYGATFINISLWLLMLIFFRLEIACGKAGGISEWAGRFLTLIFAGITVEFLGLFSRKEAKEKSNWLERIARQIILWLIPLFLSLIFIKIFTGANPVMAKLVNQFVEYFRGIEFPEAARIWFWVGAFLVINAIVAMQMTPKFFTHKFFRITGVKMVELSENGGKNWMSMMSRGLILFNLIFAVENLIDVEYLWGGVALPDNVSYAEYAHQGAYPLIFAALFSGALVLFTFRKNNSGGKFNLTKLLVYIFLAQNIFLTASAILRLSKYVNVYNLTLLRLAAFLWMFLIIAGMVLIVVKIVGNYDGQWLIRSNILISVALLSACSFCDLRGFTALHNVVNCREISGNQNCAVLDVDYLLNLGEPALPYLEAVAGKITFTASQKDEMKKLRINLYNQLDNWRQWSLKKYLIAGKLQQIGRIN